MLRCPAGGTFRGLLVMMTRAEIFNQGKNSAEYSEGNKNDHRGFVVAIEKSGDLFGVERSQPGNQEVSNAAAETERPEELLARVLQAPCGQQHGNKWKWWRQNGADGDGAKPPAVEALEEFLGTLLLEPVLNGLFAAALPERVGYVSSDDRANGGHHGVVRPQVAVARCQPNRKDIHTAGERHNGVVGYSDQNKARPAHADQPSPDEEGSSRRKWLHANVLEAVLAN